MRKKLGLILASAAAAGLALLDVALMDSAFAANTDSSASIRGSLGATLTDLSLDNGVGLCAFNLNATFALGFIIVAFVLTRRLPSQSGSSRHIAPPWLERQAC
jgi:hypothetical protein